MTITEQWNSNPLQKKAELLLGQEWAKLPEPKSGKIFKSILILIGNIDPKLSQ